MKISILVPDECIIIDGSPLWFTFSSLLPEQNIHAIQWNSDTKYGNIEYIEGVKSPLLNGDDLLKPFINAYNAEKARLAQQKADEIAAKEAQKLAEEQAVINYYDSPEQVARREAEAAKMQEIIDNLPTWEKVSAAIDNVSSLAEMKAIVKKIARVLYLVARTS